MALTVFVVVIARKASVTEAVLPRAAGRVCGGPIVTDHGVGSFVIRDENHRLIREDIEQAGGGTRRRKMDRARAD